MSGWGSGDEPWEGTLEGLEVGKADQECEHEQQDSALVFVAFPVPKDSS